MKAKESTRSLSPVASKKAERSETASPSSNGAELKIKKKKSKRKYFAKRIMNKKAAPDPEPIPEEKQRMKSIPAAPEHYGYSV